MFKGNKSSLKVHTETKDKVIPILKTNKRQILFVICLSLMRRLSFEGFRQVEVDQLEDLLNCKLCEESDNEEYE